MVYKFGKSYAGTCLRPNFLTMSIDPLARTQPTETLGNKLQSYSLHFGWLKRLGNLFLGLLCFLMTLVDLLNGYSLVKQRVFEYGPVVFWKTAQMPLISAAIFLYIACFFFWFSYKFWKMAVTLYENGLIYQDFRGVQIWFWNKIVRYDSVDTHNFLLFIPLGIDHRMILKKANGKSIVLSDSFYQIEKVIQTIREKIFPRLYSQAISDFKSGKSLEFGPLEISNKTGIDFRGKSYSLDNLEYKIDDHESLILTCQKGTKQETLRIPLYLISNLDVLLAMLAELKKAKSV